MLRFDTRAERAAVLRPPAATGGRSFDQDRKVWSSTGLTSRSVARMLALARVHRRGWKRAWVLRRRAVPIRPRGGRARSRLRIIDQAHGSVTGAGLEAAERVSTSCVVPDLARVKTPSTAREIPSVADAGDGDRRSGNRVVASRSTRRSGRARPQTTPGAGAEDPSSPRAAPGQSERSRAGPPHRT